MRELQTKQETSYKHVEHTHKLSSCSTMTIEGCITLSVTVKCILSAADDSQIGLNICERFKVGHHSVETVLGSQDVAKLNFQLSESRKLFSDFAQGCDC